MDYFIWEKLSQQHRTEKRTTFYENSDAYWMATSSQQTDESFQFKHTLMEQSNVFFFLFLFFGICVVANWKWKCLINIMMNFSKLVHWTQWKKVEKWLKSQLVDIFIMMRNSKKKKWTQNQNTKKQRTTLEWSSSCNGYGKRKL